MNNHRFKSIYSLWGFLAIAGLMTVWAWAYRGNFLEIVLRDQLARKGFIVKRIEVESFNPWKISIRNLQFARDVSLRRLEISLEWSSSLVPRLVRLRLSGLKIELGNTSSRLDWRSLTPLVKTKIAAEPWPKSMQFASWPVLGVRDADIKVFGDDGTVKAHVHLNSGSLAPAADDTLRAEKTSGLHLAAEFKLLALRAKGWVFGEGAFAVAGQIFQRDGWMHYRPIECDRFSIARLSKDNFVVDSPISVCVGPGETGHSISVDQKGQFASDIVVKMDELAISLGIGTLPPVKMKTRNGFLSIRKPPQQDDGMTRVIALRELDLVIPKYKLALDGVNFSASSAKTKQSATTLIFAFDINALRHFVLIPVFSPFKIEGEGMLEPENLSMKAVLRQETPGVIAGVQVHRDNENGEGKAAFYIHRLEFGQDRLTLSTISPLLASHLDVRSGRLQASGRFLFNDAWTSPVEITGDTMDLVVQPNSTVSSSGQVDLAVNLGQSRFKISLPPLSPEKSRITLSTKQGGFWTSSTHVGGLDGVIYFDSMHPLSCRGRHQDSIIESTDSEFIELISACIKQSFVGSRSISSQENFNAAMVELRQFLLRLQTQ